MKKIMCLIISLFILPNVVSASTNFSEWSQELPLNNKSITIKSEERYLYYEMVEGNVEYKKYDENEKRYVDLNDFKYAEPYETSDYIESDDYKTVTEKIIQDTRFYDDVRYIVFANNDSSSLWLKNITVINTLTENKIPYTLDRFNNISTLNENEFILNGGGHITLKLDETFNGLYTQIIYTLVRNNDEEVKQYSIRYMDNNDNINFSSNKLESGVSTKRYEEIPLIDECWVQRYDFFDKKVYLVSEKLFKYYDLVRKDIGYYKELEGNYLKDEEPTLFYSYKINENTKPETVVIDTCENLNYPLNVVDNATNIDKNEIVDETDFIKEDEEVISDSTSTLVSYGGTCKKENCDGYKLFGIVSFVGVLFLVLIMLIYTIIRRYKERND